MSVYNLTLKYVDFVLTCWLYAFFCKQIRPLWRHYFHNPQGIIFVVDSNDRDRVVEARDELHRMLNEVNLSSISNRLLIPLPNTKKLMFWWLEVLQQITNPIPIT